MSESAWSRTTIGEVNDYILGESIELYAATQGSGHLLEIATHAETNGALHLTARAALELGSMMSGWAVAQLSRREGTSPAKVIADIEAAQAIVLEQTKRHLGIAT